MRLFELGPDGELTREMIREYGEPLTIIERIQKKNYGLGHLKLKGGLQPILAFYEQHHYTIKTHLDWTPKGAIIRMRTLQNLYAIGFTIDQIEAILLTKKPDYIYAVPLMPFWILLKIGVPLHIAKWFMLRGDTYLHGPATIELRLVENQQLIYEQDGGLWGDCLSTFNIERIKNKLTIIDERSAGVSKTKS